MPPHISPRQIAARHIVASYPGRRDFAATSPVCVSLHFLFPLSSHVPFTSTFRFRGACARADDSVPCCCRPREGWAERREAPALNGRARRARRHACEAWAVPRNRDAASRRSTVALSAQGPLPSPALPAPVRRLHAAGQTCRPRPRASRIRGYEPRSTPLPAPPSGSSPETPLMSEDCSHMAWTRYVVNSVVGM
jgi:hypothetical protein